MTDGATDWSAWHDDYADPASPVSIRLGVVRAGIRAALDRWRAAGRTGPLTVLSACAGDGRDILGVLAEPDYRLPAEVSLLETDPRNLARAERACREAGLAGVRLLDRDAGFSSSYLDAAPADLVLMCGVFGNLTDADVRQLVDFLPALCRQGATLIWTRSRRPPDLTTTIRQWLAEAGFTELDFAAPPGILGSVGTARYDGEPRPLVGDRQLFRFTR
ncbi:MAG: SAM-dependent methyltransferase [Actinobacteria bacterium]|nr:SAM-dependent methyltransferase [Actinomycetota bacterium]